MAGIVCFGNVFDQRRLLRQLKLLNIFSQLVCCRPWAVLDSSKQYALQFNVISFWTLSLLPLPTVWIPDILKASWWWKCLLLHYLFSLWCYTSTLLHSITGHETSLILIDMESSKLASFKNYFSILAGNYLLWSWFAILLLNLGKYYFALSQLD